MNTPERYLTHLFERPVEGLPLHMSFRDYMETCMFYPGLGYYSSGKVLFGWEGDYWTYPLRMSPVFGELLSLRVMELWQRLAPRMEAAEHRFTLAEVGGGKGDLMRDLLAALNEKAETDDRARALLDRLDVLEIDKSPSLLADQEEMIGHDGVTYLNTSATEMSAILPRPFFGMLFANELLTQLSAEVLRIDRGGAARLRVLPWLHPNLASLTQSRPDEVDVPGVDPTYRPLRPGALPDLIRALTEDKTTLRDFVAGRLAAWTGVLEPIDGMAEPKIQEYLDFLEPAIARLDRLHALPTWLVYAPEVTRVLDDLASILSTGAGVFMTVDYGGMSYHVLDTHSRCPHLRTFTLYSDGQTPRPPLLAQSDENHNPFFAPGCADLTYDLDFTWTSSYLKNLGLVLAKFGHQGALEAGVDLWKQPSQKKLVAGRLKERFKGTEAHVQAHELLLRFRSGFGYRVLAMATPGIEDVFASMGPSDPLFFNDLEGLAETWDKESLRATLIAKFEREGLKPERARLVADDCVGSLHTTGSVVDDLGDIRQYNRRFLVLEALGYRGHRPDA